LGILKITQIIEKNINQITFVEEGPDCGSEDIEKECNVNCVDISSFLSFWWTSWMEKSHST